MHWFVAAAVIVLLALGPATKRLAPEGALRDNLYNFHEALGALVLIVMVVGLARRIAFGGPAQMRPSSIEAASAPPEAKPESNRGEGVDPDREDAGRGQAARIGWRRE